MRLIIPWTGPQDFSGDLRVISMLDHRENSVEKDFKNFNCMYKVGQKLDCFES